MTRRINITLLCAGALATSRSARAEDTGVVLSREVLAETARQEAAACVQPGVPGSQPFWNAKARKFIYAPAFDFAASEGATGYRFTALSGTDFDTYTFTAETPWSDLRPIWPKLPVGMVELTVEAMKGDKVLAKIGTRRFQKDSPFRGPYRAPVVAYRAAAHKLLESTFNQPYIRCWLETGKPDPKFGHYSYPSKIIGAVVEAMTLAMREDLPFREDARKIGDKAATFLIETSLPADSPFAFFPLTYDPTLTQNPVSPSKKYNGQLMMFYAAEVGLQYLDLYKLTEDARLLEAARRIADTYVRTQLPSGTWPIKARITDGTPLGHPLCIPVHVIRFLHELATTHQMSEYARPCQAAFDWIMNNSVRTFDWAGQFEDINQDQPPYANLSARAAALYFVIYLIEHHGDDAAKMAIARDLLRFSEDQFIVWERPAPSLSLDLYDLTPGHGAFGNRQIGDTSTWVTPVVLEQYSYYVPIGTSGSVALEAFLAAWRHEGRELDLAKAISFANNMTYLQLLHGDGGIPTHWAVTHRGCQGWINNLASQARALLAAADALENKKVVVVEQKERPCTHTVQGIRCPYADGDSVCPYTGNALVKGRPESGPAK